MDKKTFTTLFTSRRDAVVAVKDGVVIFFNDAAEKVFGKIEEGQNAEELFPAALFKAGDESASCSVSCAGGSAPAVMSKYEDVHIVTVMPELGRDGLFMDTLASLNTNIRESLSIMQMSAGVIEQNSPRETDEKIKRYSAICRHAYYNLARVTDHLSELCAQGQDKLRISCFDIAELYRDTVEAATYLAGINGPQMVFECEEKSILFNGDSGRLEQLLLNLLSNSLKFTGQEGTVRVKLKKQKYGVVLTVSDNGSGIDEKMMPELFSMYHGRRDLKDVKSGMGMGLPLVQHIAELHSGSAVIESTRGRGTTVTVLLKSRDDEVKFKMPEEEYKVRGLSRSLMELSDVLTYESFMPNNLD